MNYGIDEAIKKENCSEIGALRGYLWDSTDFLWGRGLVGELITSLRCILKTGYYGQCSTFFPQIGISLKLASFFQNFFQYFSK